MADKLVGYAFQYACYILEVSLLILLARRSYGKRLTSVTCYLASLLAVGAGRSYVLNSYGLASRQYWYSFWLTDILLQLVLFLLVCSFFRRACGREENLWRFVRLLLIFVFILVLGVSWLSLSRNYEHFVTAFVVEFEQNLYFTCLVLTTFLYLLLQQTQSADEELGLLVCGFGIQCAGPAASFALAHLTLGQRYSESLVKFIMPLCTLGMLLTWFYAVARTSKTAAVPPVRERVPDGGEVAVLEA